MKFLIISLLICFTDLVFAGFDKKSEIKNSPKQEIASICTVPDLDYMVNYYNLDQKIIVEQQKLLTVNSSLLKKDQSLNINCNIYINGVFYSKLKLNYFNKLNKKDLSEKFKKDYEYNRKYWSSFFNKFKRRENTVVIIYNNISTDKKIKQLAKSVLTVRKRGLKNI